jgi:hypothetical protein
MVAVARGATFFGGGRSMAAFTSLCREMSQTSKVLLVKIISVSRAAAADGCARPIQINMAAASSLMKDFMAFSPDVMVDVERLNTIWQGITASLIIVTPVSGNVLTKLSACTQKF